MKKIRKSTLYSHRVFAAVLAAALLFTMPGMASYAEAEDAQTKDISESVTVQAEDDAAEETEAETEVIQESEAEDSDTDQPGTGEDDTKDTEMDDKEPAEEETVPAQKEDVKECTCGTLCTQDSINGDCSVCGAEDADLSRCKGEKTENSSEENKEDAGQGDTGAQDDSANLCAHHKEHTKDCGYSRASEDGEGSPCTYECKFCPIEDLIAALPDEVTEDNAEKVRAQLDEILALYRELTAEEQEQIDLTRGYDLQAALDKANAPVTVDGHAEQQADDEAKVDIGGNITYYSTLGEAFSAANGKNATITMLTNAECTSSDFNNPSPLVISGGIVTLDMNGKTLSGEGYGTGGIIGISGGSLAVQGNGTVEVRYSGMICTGGTLTVADTTFNLVGPGYGSAACAIQNGSQDTGKGGTVIINGGTITGVASDDYGQIFHYVGTTIINNVTTMDGTHGVFFQNDGKSRGKLIINGGTFNNTIEVDFSDEGIQSVEALLGDGYAYKHRGGTWATDDDLAGLTISNVTVEKIPLTIKPHAETSWYYNSGAHSLQMNAAPATEGKTITYEWYDGSTKLDCTADAYPVPETMAVGNYTYTCKAACDGYTLSHEFAFTVAACPHTGLVYEAQANNKHGGTCPDCGEVVSEEHTWVDGTCEDCNLKAAVKVEIGNATTYYGGIDAAWVAAEGHTATVTLLDHVTVSMPLFVNGGDDITFDGGKFTLTGPSNNNRIIYISGGKLTVTGGTLKTGENTSGPQSFDIIVNGGELVVTGGSLETGTGFVGLSVMGNAPVVKLSGGTFHGIGMSTNDTVGHLLLNYGSTDAAEKHYAYYQGNEPVDLTKLDRQYVLTSIVTVGECDHTGVDPTPNNDGTHTLKCPYCGYTGPAANCSYGTEYQHNDTYHWKTCTVCQGTTTPEAHYLRVTADEPVNGVTQNREACDYCDFTKNPFTVTVTVPSGLTYGNTVGIKPSFTVSTEKTFDAVQLVLEDGEGKIEYMTGDILPDNLSAGSYKLYLSGGVLGNPEPVFKGRAYFTVAPAPLTGNMVTLSPESVTYSGTEQKPTITVKQGNTTLKEGTDYDVAYSPADLTNAGTVTVTITGKGNYTGEVKTAYTIKKAPLTITASSQTITYGGSIVQGTDNVSAAGLCSGDSLDSITLTASTTNVPGGNITPSAAGIKNSGGKDVTGNYEITYKDGGLTINKAGAEITVGTGTYSKTFGDAAFALDVTDNNTEADVQYEVTAGADVISVSNGTVTVKNAGTATITVSLPETANYNAAASKTITVNVVQKGGYTVAEQNRSYLYSRENTGSIDLAALLPKDCGAVTYGTPAASGDVTYSATPAVNDGKLSYTLNSGSKNAEGTITVTVSTRNYTDITITVKVKLTDRIPVSLKTGTKVTLKDNVLTYGEPLSKLVFNETEFVGDDGNTVAGTLAWKAAAVTPNAGTISAVWVFTPADTAYISVDGTVTITVNQATPTVSETPELTDRVYNPSIALKDDDLSSVTVTGVDGKILEGKWSWQSADIVSAVDNSGYEAVFTPKDTTNYETVTRTITVTVTKATPYIAELPAAAAVTYGETLKDSLLLSGTAVYGDGKGQAGSTETVAGAFTWKEPSTKPVAADSNVTEFAVVFTPSDTANYNPVEAAVKLTVNKAQNAPNMPGSTMSVSNSIEKVGSVPLPAGWEWRVKDTALEAGVAVSAVAVYTGADKGNYENETVTVAITRSSCDHVAGDILYTGESEKKPTCAEDGLGHRECTRCSSVVESSIVVKALGHTGGTATCSKRAVCTRCNQPYGDTDSNIHGGTEVRGFVEATCTASGYTGDTYCKDCGAKTGAGNATPALGHDYKGRVTREPTTEREGERTYTCTRCGDQYTKSMPRLPGDDTTKPSSGQPGDTEPGRGNTEETRPEPDIPFIKGEDGKTGWEVIRAEEEQAKEGSIINVDMNGTTVVPGDIFDSINGRDITIAFDMGGGIIWSVDGKSVTADRTGDIDFSVKTGVNSIPVDIVNNVTGERYSIQISLAHEGEFGFTAVLSINLGKENAGYTASLYYYNQSTGELEFICADEVAEDGTASLAFTHASDYVIAIDGDEEESGITESAQSESTEGTAGSNTTAQESPRTGQAGGLWWIIVAILLTAAIGTGTVLAVRKKGKDE